MQLQRLPTIAKVHGLLFELTTAQIWLVNCVLTPVSVL